MMFWTILFVIFLTCHFELTQCQETFPELLRSTRRLLDYYRDNYKDINLDGIFGLRVLEGEARSLLQKSERLDIEVKTFLNNVMEESYNISELSLPFVRQDDPEYFEKLAPLVKAPILQSKPYRKIDPWYLWRDSDRNPTTEFTEERSDECFTELLTQTHSATCQLSVSCLEMVADKGREEYGVTHQLLYTMVAEQGQCIPNVNSHLVRKGYTGGISEFQLSLCTNIFYEAASMVQMFHGDIRPIIQDLFMEQAFVCGMLGFMEFLHVDWLRQIISWQKPSGCFGKMPAAPVRGKVPNLPEGIEYDYVEHKGSQVDRSPNLGEDGIDDRAAELKKSNFLADDTSNRRYQANNQQELGDSRVFVRPQDQQAGRPQDQQGGKPAGEHVYNDLSANQGLLHQPIEQSQQRMAEHQQWAEQPKLGVLQPHPWQHLQDPNKQLPAQNQPLGVQPQFQLSAQQQQQQQAMVMNPPVHKVALNLQKDNGDVQKNNILGVLLPGNRNLVGRDIGIQAIQNNAAFQGKQDDVDDVVVQQNIGNRNLLYIHSSKNNLSHSDYNTDQNEIPKLNRQEPVSTHLGVGRRLLVEKSMSGDCLAHKTGVAAGIISQYIRYYLEPSPPQYNLMVQINGINFLLQPIPQPLPEGQGRPSTTPAKIGAGEGPGDNEGPGNDVIDNRELGAQSDNNDAANDVHRIYGDSQHNDEKDPDRLRRDTGGDDKLRGLGAWEKSVQNQAFPAAGNQGNVGADSNYDGDNEDKPQDYYSEDEEEEEEEEEEEGDDDDWKDVIPPPRVNLADRDRQSEDEALYINVANKPDRFNRGNNDDQEYEQYIDNDNLNARGDTFEGDAINPKHNAVVGKNVLPRGDDTYPYDYDGADLKPVSTSPELSQKKQLVNSADSKLTPNPQNMHQVADKNDSGVSIGTSYAIVLVVMLTLLFYMNKFVRRRRILIRYR